MANNLLGSYDLENEFAPQAAQPPVQPQPNNQVYDELLNQYRAMSQPDPIEVEELQKAREARANQERSAAILQAAAKLGQGISGATAPIDNSAYEQMRKQAQERLGYVESDIKGRQDKKKNQIGLLKDIADQQRSNAYLKIQQGQEERAQKREPIQHEKDQLELTKMRSQNMQTEMMANPNDPYAEKWRSMLTKRYPDLAPQFTNASVNQMLESVGFVSKADQQQFSNQMEKDTLAARKESNRIQSELKQSINEAKIIREEEKAQAKRDELLDKKVTKYKDDLQKTSIPALTSAIQQVQEVLPPTGDVPGYGRLAGALPDVAVSRTGEQLRERVATLFNITLKDRSGAAVTDPELARLQKEFGAGTWKDDKSLRDGINSYIKRLQEVSKNITGGTPPEVIEKYQEQGGSNYQKLLDDYRAKSEPKKPRKPQTIIQNGHTYQLNPATGQYE